MGKYLRISASILIFLLTLNACQGDRAGQPAQPGQPTPAVAEIQIQSSAFVAGGTIPQRHTCDGDDISPPLTWSEPPAGTQSLALIVDDPDAPAGTWDHWLLFNIPATVRSLTEGIPPTQVIDGTGTHGNNSWGRPGYGGPCPPKGSTHRYEFKLYALDTVLDLDPGVGKRELEKAMSGHILAAGQLSGRYGR